MIGENVKKKALVILADGFEEVEAVTPIDVLRRAGIEVALAGLSGKKVKSARGMVIESDILLNDYRGLPDVLILPGGMLGSSNLAESKDVLEIINKMDKAKRIIAAICAAPALVLTKTGILNNKTATCYPECEESFSSDINFSNEKIILDGHILTSQGPGTAFQFSFKIVSLLVGEETTNKLKEKMLVF